MENRFVVKGNIYSSRTEKEIAVWENAYLLAEDGKISGIFSYLPERYRGLPCTDYGDAMIIPGMTDLHLHAPQYSFRGTNMDMELLDWLNTNTFPEESKYRNMDYAERGYTAFSEDLKYSGTTRAVIFATIHREATTLLMEKLEESGLCTYVGKVNMDRNSPDYLCERSAEESLESTRAWLRAIEGRFRRTLPILTPRFTPSCTDALMKGLGKLRGELSLPVQSHLSENVSEIAWVRELCPWSGCYGDTYDRFGLLRGAVMAHCVHSSEEEIALLKRTDAFIAHCPQSNTNLASGIAPIRRYLSQGLNVGLGTDVAGGANLSMFRAAADAIAVSKLRWRIQDQSLSPLSFPEAFYLATRGGGRFFGEVGKLEAGYEADFLVLREKKRSVRTQSPLERLEQFFYLAEENGGISAKYVQGRKLFG